MLLWIYWLRQQGLDAADAHCSGCRLPFVHSGDELRWRWHREGLPVQPRGKLLQVALPGPGE